jgi:hypothetical protein
LSKIFAFFLSENSAKKTAFENGEIIVYRIKKVISKNFSELFEKIDTLTDERKRKKYSIAEIVMAGLFLFILKEGQLSFL